MKIKKFQGYPFATDMIRQETKTKLSEDRSGLGRDFDSSIRGGGQRARSSINVANHEIGEVYSKEIVRVGETKCD